MYISLLTTITNKIIILRYSLRKNLTNSPPLNSVLNLETNSDSLSIKSIGVRPTSHENTKYITPNITNIFGINSKITNSTISYLQARTINRYPPIFEYMLLDSIILLSNSNIKANIITIII